MSNQKNNPDTILLNSAPAGKVMHTVAASHWPSDCWFFMHRYELARDTGATKYYQCRRCRSRKAEQVSTVYQPIDWDWIKDERDIVIEPEAT